MVKVIAGRLRGKNLLTPEGTDTRPTRSGVREALFNIWQFRLPDSRFLDLFAGSGATGIEALSRGAQSAVFCDKSREAVSVIRKNLAACRLEAEVLEGEALSCLARLKGRQFDLIFLDPPYDGEEGERAAALILDEGLLAEGGQLCREYEASRPPREMPGFALLSRRRYGRTGLDFYGLARPD